MPGPLYAAMDGVIQRSEAAMGAVDSDAVNRSLKEIEIGIAARHTAIKDLENSNLNALEQKNNELKKQLDDIKILISPKEPDKSLSDKQKAAINSSNSVIVKHVSKIKEDIANLNNIKNPAEYHENLKSNLKNIRGNVEAIIAELKYQKNINKSEAEKTNKIIDSIIRNFNTANKTMAEASIIHKQAKGHNEETHFLNAEIARLENQQRKMNTYIAGMNARIEEKAKAEERKREAIPKPSAGYIERNQSIDKTMQAMGLAVINEYIKNRCSPPTELTKFIQKYPDALKSTDARKEKNDAKVLRYINDNCNLSSVVVNKANHFLAMNKKEEYTNAMKALYRMDAGRCNMLLGKTEIAADVSEKDIKAHFDKETREVKGGQQVSPLRSLKG